jgi:hypothetical protein
MKVPDLNERIAAHARAVIAGDDATAEAFVASASLAPWRAACASIKGQYPFRDFDLLARAKIGMQYMAKTRFHGAHGVSTLLIRWKKLDGTWTIADAEDITGKRSPWTDIPHYSRESGGRPDA